MACKYSFQFPLEHGLHARPASVLRDAADQHAASVRLVNHRNGIEANAKSVLSLVSADIRIGDSCSLLVDGESERESCDALTAFLTNIFPNCDEPLPGMSDDCGEAAPPPRVVESSGARAYRGVPAASGVAEASAFVVEPDPLPDFPDTCADAKSAFAAFEAAVEETSAAIARSLKAASNATETDILNAHQAILRDPEFRDRVKVSIAAGNSVGRAIADAQRYYSDLLGASESLYLRERVMDIRDVCLRLLRNLYPNAVVAARPEPAGPHILIAQDLTPSEFLAQDKSLLKGIVLSEGGATSHTVILSRAAGVPCIIGAREVHHLIVTGDPLILDAKRGIVLPDPPEEVRRYYHLEMERARKRREQLSVYLDAPGRTADGRHIEIAANAGSAEEAVAAFDGGAEGIGLLRTELLFMDREAPPSEEEQLAVYTGVIAAAKGRPVIIRTLDVGGDKPVPYLRLPDEPNPFLGYRAVRFYPEHEDLVISQVRAILRAAALGPVRVMVPMVSCLEEIRAMHSLVALVEADLRASGVEHGQVEVGIMVEVPSAALMIAQLSEEADFFSIGTNDLAQYLMAVDRGNRKVGRLAGLLHPALLRLLMKIVDDAHAAGRWVGMCGEMAGMERMAPVLVGLGLDELSMAGPGVPGMKAAIGRWRTNECRAMVAAAAAQPTVADSEALVSSFSPEGQKFSELDEAITNLKSDAGSRDEAIKELVDLLSLSGRVSDPDMVEEAVWRREDVYATGVGYGFAIPHCKAKDVLVNSIGFLKLNKPIVWNPQDDEPVSIVLLLAIRESEYGEAHLRIFAKLARKIMHDEFRERLLAEDDATKLVEFIQNEIQ